MAQRRDRSVNAKLTEASKAQDATISGDWTFTGTVDLTSATLSGLSSDDLSDVASIAMLDEAETITGNWSFGTTTVDLSAATVTGPFTVNTAGDGYSHLAKRGGTQTGGLYHDATNQYWLNSSGQTVIQNPIGSKNISLGGTLTATAAGTQTLGGTTVNLSPSGNINLNPSSGNVLVGGGAHVRVFESGNTYYASVSSATTTGTPNSVALFKNSEAGGIRVQSVSIADDATATFVAGSTRYMAFIWNTFNQNTQAILAVSETNAPNNFAVGSLVSTGAANPDIDGRVNIWPATTSSLSIKNRLGSTRTFYVLFLEA